METKKCATCRMNIPIDGFGLDKRNKDGFKGTCKRCCAIRTSRWRSSNRDKARASTKNWKQANPDKNRDTKKRYRDRKRKDAILVLGGACLSCGNSDPRVLEIDHVEGGGTADRKGGQIAILNKVISGEPGFQLLCANCHKIKTHEKGEFTTNNRQER